MRRRSGVVALRAAAAGLAVASTRLPWARADPACANTDAVLGFGEGPTGALWAGLFLAAVAGALAAGTVPRGASSYVGLGASVVAAVAVLWGLGIANRPAFEAFRPGNSGPPVGVLCRFDPAAGYWTGVASSALLVGVGLAATRNAGTVRR